MTVTLSHYSADTPATPILDGLNDELSRLDALIEMFERDADLTIGSGERVTFDSLCDRRRQVLAELQRRRELDSGFRQPRSVAFDERRLIVTAAAALAGCALLRYWQSRRR